jgi:hypothetical protein
MTEQNQEKRERVVDVHVAEISTLIFRNTNQECHHRQPQTNTSRSRMVRTNTVTVQISTAGANRLMGIMF